MVAGRVWEPPPPPLVSLAQDRAQGVPPDGSLEDVGSPPSSAPGSGPPSPQRAPWGPSPGLTFGENQLLPVCVQNPVVSRGGGGGSSARELGGPVLARPIAPRRNLITLFSWFRFCF